jgi:hypothetical protein
MLYYLVHEKDEKYLSGMEDGSNTISVYFER